MIIEKNDRSLWQQNPSQTFWDNDVAYILSTFANPIYDSIIIDEGQVY